METIEKIFELAREKGLENVSIRIIDKLTGIDYILYVKEKDRMLAESLDELVQMLLDHKESLSWMNN